MTNGWSRTGHRRAIFFWRSWRYDGGAGDFINLLFAVLNGRFFAKELAAWNTESLDVGSPIPARFW